MILRGYVGKILWVNLTAETTSIKDLDEGMARKYIGGAGLAAKILWDETSQYTEPLSSENPLIFMTGPLTETLVPSSSRYVLSALSPLTGIWGEAHSGGHWACQLKRAGFDGIVVRGKASKPTYLWVNDGKAKLMPAGYLWGKDTYETDDLIKKETHQRASVASIGQAGERLVRIACVMNDGRAGRAAARCGLGAVMGYKNLKAIAVIGTVPPKVSDKEGLKESIRLHYPTVPLSVEERKPILAEWWTDIWGAGRVPIKNYMEGELKGFKEKLIAETQRGELYFCGRCRQCCAESYMVDGGRRPVYEAIAPLGSQCLVDNMEAIARAFELCQRYGLDSISTGGVIAFAMEAYEKGAIGKVDTEGIDLTWGNAEAMVEMVRNIGERKGFGRLLGQGVRKAAEEIGGISEEYALHVKGLEFPAIDPRATNSVAVGYATANIGAGHLSGVRGINCPETGLVKETSNNRFETEGKGAKVAIGQNFMSLVNSLGVCSTPAGGNAQRYGGAVVSPSLHLEWLNYATGWDMNLVEFMRAGERIFNLQRMINVRRGISGKDDTLPARFLSHKLREGGAAGHVPHLGSMLGEYYSSRGWNEDGIPTRQKLGELDLGDVAEALGLK